MAAPVLAGSDRLYRLLLRAYPAPFRERFGAEPEDADRAAAATAAWARAHYTRA